MPIHSIPPLRGACHRSEGRSCPEASTLSKALSSTALEFYTVSISLEPEHLQDAEPAPAFASVCAAPAQTRGLRDNI